jgi:hypothetical protein
MRTVIMWAWPVLVGGMAAVCAGCTAAPTSSGSVEPAGSAPHTTAIGLPTGETAEVRLTRDDYVSRADIAAPRSVVWQALPDAFTDVGLPERAVDAARWLVAVQEHTIRQRLGRDALSVFLDCGTSPAGANANVHRIRLDVVAALDPVGASATRVSIRVSAVARTTEGTSMAPVQCSSSGELERRIVRALERRVPPEP